MVSHSRARPRGSTPEVGSSRISSSGWCASAWRTRPDAGCPSGSWPTGIAGPPIAAAAWSRFAPAAAPAGCRRRRRRTPGSRPRSGRRTGRGPAGRSRSGAGLAGRRLAEQQDPARRRRDQAEQHPDQGGLACAVRAEQPDDLARPDLMLTSRTAVTCTERAASRRRSRRAHPAAGRGRADGRSVRRPGTAVGPTAAGRAVAPHRARAPRR